MAGNPRIEDLRKRLDKEPNSRLFAQLAEELRKDGALSEAIRIARDGLRKHPAYPSARMTLGRALLDTGDWASARVEFESVLQGAPDNILASRFLGECLEGLGQFDAAVKRYKATLAMSPGDKQVMARLAGLEAGGAGGASSAQAPSPPAPGPAEVSARAGAASGPVALPSVRAAGPAAEPPPIPLVAVDDESFELDRPFATSGTEWQPQAAAPPATAAPRTEAPAMEFEEEGPATIFGKAGAWQVPQVAAQPPAMAAPSLEDAERHFEAGATEQALEIYRQALALDPGNGRLEARIKEIEALQRHLRGETTSRAASVVPATSAGATAQPEIAADPVLVTDFQGVGHVEAAMVPAPGSAVDRRQAVLRTIDRLEGFLAAVERSRP